MRKLTPEQARAVWDALSEPVDEAMMGNMHLKDVWAEMELRLAAITAKPGDPEFCEGCMQWARVYDTDGQEHWCCSFVTQIEQTDPDVGIFLWSLPPPRECPIGMWEERDDEG